MAFTPLDDNEAKAGTITNVELATALKDNINYLIDALPIGTIVPILVGIGAVPAPNPTIWHPCNGSPITDINSPLRGNNSPDLSATKQLWKGANTLGEVGAGGGAYPANAVSFAHNHGGITGDYNIDQNADTDDDYFDSVASHHHQIFSDLGSYDVEPPNVRLIHYIKIN